MKLCFQAPADLFLGAGRLQRLKSFIANCQQSVPITFHRAGIEAGGQLARQFLGLRKQRQVHTLQTVVDGRQKSPDLFRSETHDRGQ